MPGNPASAGDLALEEIDSEVHDETEDVAIINEV